MIHRLIGWLAFALAMVPARADLVVEITGQPGSSIIWVTISGSGTWQADDLGFIVGNGIGWSGDFAGDDLGSLDAFVDAAPILTGALTLDNAGTLVNLTSLILDSDGASFGADDFALLALGNSVSVLENQAYSFSGTASFDLGTLGDPDLGALATFDDLSIGTFVTTDPTAFPDGLDVGSVTLQISAVAGVPEPSAALLGVVVAGLAALGRLRSLRLAARLPGASAASG